MPRWPVTPEIDEMLTIEPPPAFFMIGIANFMPRNVPRRVDRHQPVPGGGVEQVLDRAAADPGIVDQDVELAEGGQGRVDRRLAIRPRC